MKHNLKKDAYTLDQDKEREMLRFGKDIFFGVLEARAKYDHFLGKFSSKPANDLPTWEQYWFDHEERGRYDYWRKSIDHVLSWSLMSR